MRFAVFAWDPSDTPDHGVVVGTTHDPLGANQKAAAILWAGDRVGLGLEVAVMPVLSPRTSAHDIAEAIADRKENYETDAPDASRPSS